MQPTQLNPIPVTASKEPFYRSMQQAGAQQRDFNNPNTANPWAATQVNADGSSSTGFTGQFRQLNDSLTNQAAQAASTPLNFGKFGVGDGSAAGQQTSNAMFGQMKSRLDPAWQKSERALRGNMFQSGMGDSSAADSEMQQFGRDRNDAYSGAMSQALRAGMGAQQSAYAGNLDARKLATDNAYSQKMQPLNELGQMQGFLAQPDYNKDNSKMVAAAQSNQQADAAQVQDVEGKMRAKMKKAYPDQNFDGMSMEQMRDLLTGGAVPWDPYEWAMKP